MLKMGCVKVDITPKGPEYLLGYGARNCLSKFVVDKLHAGVMILAQGNKKVLLLTIDNSGLNTKNCEAVYKELAATGFDKSNTFLCCSHTHFAPGIFQPEVVTFPKGELPIGHIPAPKAYSRFFISQVKKGIQQALKKLEPVTMEEAAIPVSELSMNRRPIVKKGKNKGKVETNYTYPLPPADEKYNWQPVDPLFYVWRFKDAKGKLKGIVGRFSCHPVTGGDNDYYGVSADYPGYFQQYVEEVFKCPGFFILGNAGDLVPLRRQGQSRQDIGHVLTYAIRMADWTFRPSPDFKLGLTKVGQKLKLRHPCRVKEIKKLIDAKIKEDLKNQEYTRELVALHYEYWNADVHGGPQAELPLTFMPFGSKIIVGLPFEVLTSVGKAIMEACPNAIVTSITCGYNGYLPMASEIPQGGYECEEGNHFEDKAGDKVAALAIKTVKAMTKKLK